MKTTVKEAKDLIKRANKVIVDSTDATTNQLMQEIITRLENKIDGLESNEYLDGSVLETYNELDAAMPEL